MWPQNGTIKVILKIAGKLQSCLFSSKQNSWRPVIKGLSWLFEWKWSTLVAMVLLPCINRRYMLSIFYLLSCFDSYHAIGSLFSFWFVSVYMLEFDICPFDNFFMRLIWFKLISWPKFHWWIQNKLWPKWPEVKISLPINKARLNVLFVQL